MMKNKIHLINLLLQLPKMKFTTKQKDAFLSSIVETIEMFGKKEIAAENLSYLLHCIKTIPKYHIDWRHHNQLMICFSKLVEGISLSIDAQKVLSELDEESKDETSQMSSTSFVPKINLLKASYIEKRQTPLQRFGSN